MIPALIHDSDISGIPPGSHSLWHIFWHSFWHSIWYIFGDSLWLSSSWDHFHPAVAVRARRGPLRSSACSWNPAGATLIPDLLLGSGGDDSNRELAVEVRRGLLFGPGRDHCDLALAVEVRRGTPSSAVEVRRKRRRRRRRRRPADTKSNNPHLTGGEQKTHLTGGEQKKGDEPHSMFFRDAPD